MNWPTIFEKLRGRHESFEKNAGGGQITNGLEILKIQQTPNQFDKSNFTNAIETQKKCDTTHETKTSFWTDGTEI